MHTLPMALARRAIRQLLRASVLAFLVLSATAAPQRTDVSSTFAARGGFVGISVADLAGSVEWYRTTFGLHTVMRIPATSGSAAVTVLEGSGMIVELLQAGGS